MVAQLERAIPTVAELEVEKAARRLRDFIPQAWHVVEPVTPFRSNWHIDAICEHLEAVVAGEIRNLLINMPPRMMKSLTVSVFFPAWRWIRAPETRFLYSSYAQSLATDHSVATRRVIESDWYQERWGHIYQLADDENLKTKFENTRRGKREATSVGGVGTGKGGDIIVVDDPHNVLTAESDTIRESTVDWWDKVMSTRFNDPKTGSRIIVMQRVHDADLSGHVLEQGGYEHLCLPMEYEPTTHVTGIGWSDPRSKEGTLLAPDRFGPEQVKDAKQRLGSNGYAGQMQQRPTPAEGGTFKVAWWRAYSELPDEISRAEVTLDSAFKTGVGNDFTAAAAWALDRSGNAYLVRAWRKKVEFPDLIKKGVEWWQWARERFPATAIPLVPEDKASGQSAIQVWRREKHVPVIPFPVEPGSTKLSRAEGVTPYIEGGRVFIPKRTEENADWLDPWLEEHTRFPNGAHDDQVDTTSMALARLLSFETDEPDVVVYDDPVTISRF